MRNRYIDLIDQTYYFPQDGFRVEDNYLRFHNIDIKKLIDEYGTPLKITYLPKIATNINRARSWFQTAIEKIGYTGNYHYCYCTKSSHFAFIMDEALRNGAHLETSSAVDIDLIRRLYKQKKIDKVISKKLKV
jgi:arginine decarboxylase